MLEGEVPPMPDIHHFVEVEFQRFKAFTSFRLRLRHFNILVGPNNAGKSTVLAAFRILALAMRRASSRKPEVVSGPLGLSRGYIIDLSSASVSEENLFYNYDESEPAIVKFKLSNQNELILYFPEHGTCHLITSFQGRQVGSPSEFKRRFNCPIGFVPILGPVEHNENLREERAARLALFSYGAARSFRNIWYHYPDKFELFQTTLADTWPGMDITHPERIMDNTTGKSTLAMLCPEERIPREISWAGFGFQVWCQMLTHMIQSNDKALFMIDEPDIYLHSDLQRQLLGLLRDLGPDILIATHSTEMITEAEADDIVLIDKKRKSAKRIRNSTEIGSVFSILGSTLNPTLTQLAKTRRALFLEGNDFQILGLFARKLGATNVANRGSFAIISIGGFNPERIRNLKDGMEITLGSQIHAIAVLDRDFRSEEERKSVEETCRSFCEHVFIHKKKEVENFLLVPEAMDRAAKRRLVDQARRGGAARPEYAEMAQNVLEVFCQERRSYIAAQYVAFRKQYQRGKNSSIHDATITEIALKEFDEAWGHPESRLSMVPGKEALAYFNRNLQDSYGVNLTPTNIVGAMSINEIPEEMRDLIGEVQRFSREDVSTEAG